MGPWRASFPGDHQYLGKPGPMNQLRELLERYGPTLCSYEGHGRLHLRSETAVKVKFVATQLPDGENIILYQPQVASSLLPFLHDDILGLTGETSDGLSVQTRGQLLAQDIPGSIPPGGGQCWDGCTAERIRIWTRSETPETVRYGLTNVRPPGRPKLPLHLKSGGISIEAELRRVSDYKLIFDSVRILGDTAVTCELEIWTQGQLTAEDTQQVASAVCYLLSIAQGCGVAWIYREEHDEQGLISREHLIGITRPFTALQVVPSHPHTSLQEFVEMTYPTYMRRRDPWELGLGPIDAYLDAKAEGDFLEIRAAKLAVALAILETMSIGRSPAPRSRSRSNRLSTTSCRGAPPAQARPSWRFNSWKKPDQVTCHQIGGGHMAGRFDQGATSSDGSGRNASALERSRGCATGFSTRPSFAPS